MMKKKAWIYTKNFLMCGFMGWGLECFWTGFSSLINKDKKLTCHTSYWMFPIYGLAVLIHPAHRAMKNCCTFTRGMVYTSFIFLVEYVTGILLKRIHACPWDYCKAKFNIKGVVRLDYLPAWFGMGLLYEKILNMKFTNLQRVKHVK